MATSDSPPHILVTGGTGFVGGHLIADLAGEYRVTCVSRTRQSPDAPTINVDIADEDVFSRLPDDVDLVIHLAAYIPDDQGNDELRKCDSVNAQGTLNVLEYARRRGIEKVIYVSSCHYFDSRVENENVEYTLNPPNRYEASKYAGEVLGKVYRDAHGLEISTLLASYIYGAGMPENTVVHHFIERAMAGEELVLQNGGLDTTDFVYVDDLVRSIRSAIDGPTGEFVVGSGSRSSIRDLADAVRAAAGPDVDITREPPTGEPSDHFVHSSDANGELEFEARYSLEDGIAETISAIQEGVE